MQSGKPNLAAHRLSKHFSGKALELRQITPSLAADPMATGEVISANEFFDVKESIAKMVDGFNTIGGLAGLTISEYLNKMLSKNDQAL